VRLRLGPPSCPPTWSFPFAQTILSVLTQGPAVTLADRRRPLRRSSGSLPNRACHSEVAGQGTACRVVERAFTTLRRAKTQDNCQRRGTKCAPGDVRRLT
jgi:hypothetical protein